MSKRKERHSRQALFERVAQIAAGSGHGDAPIPDAVLASSKDLARLLTPLPGAQRELPKMKKFRFQLLSAWIRETLPPCRVADIGGGKGLLAYLLNQAGWQATVIDPVRQALPEKYKDLRADRQVRIAATETVPRLDLPFAPEMARDFDLLVAMHAHGCNLALIDAAAQHRRSVVLLPCCVIGEPLHPPAGTHWLPCVADYATRKGLVLEPFRLNFKGQNIGLYGRWPRQGIPCLPSGGERCEPG